MVHEGGRGGRKSPKNCPHGLWMPPDTDPRAAATYYAWNQSHSFLSTVAWLLIGFWYNIGHRAMRVNSGQKFCNSQICRGLPFTLKYNEEIIPCSKYPRAYRRRWSAQSRAPVVFILYAYNCRPGLGCLLTSTLKVHSIWNIQDVLSLKCILDENFKLARYLVKS